MLVLITVVVLIFWGSFYLQVLYLWRSFYMQVLYLSFESELHLKRKHAQEDVRKNSDNVDDLSKFISAKKTNIK